MIYQPKPGADYTAPNNTIDNNPLNVVDKFTYLGSTISQNALIDDDISSRIGKESGSFGKLTKCLWSERGVRLGTHINGYCAVVLPTLLYGCEAWTPYRRHIRRLDHHEWILGSGAGSGGCSHEPLDEGVERDKPWLEAGSPAHKALSEVVLNSRLLRTIHHYVNFRCI